jgi:uracil phosphoribosyltransferase
MANFDIPKNAHISTHPCLQAKLSQLRSEKTGCRDAQTLVHEIALMVGYEALAAGLTTKQEGTVRHPSEHKPFRYQSAAVLGVSYTSTTYNHTHYNSRHSFK